MIPPEQLKVKLHEDEQKVFFRFALCKGIIILMVTITVGGDHCKHHNKENKSPSSTPNFSKLPIRGDDPFGGSWGGLVVVLQKGITNLNGLPQAEPSQNFHLGLPSKFDMEKKGLILGQVVIQKEGLELVWDAFQA